ncbi:MAG: signal peptidase II [Pseudomonadota bacterium]
MSGPVSGAVNWLRALFTPARLAGLALAALIAGVDQWVKEYVTITLGVSRIGASMELLPFFDLTYTQNKGISLGMLEANSLEMRWLLVAMTACIALVVLVWMMREKLFGDIVGLALILGGAIGNIIDRHTLGYVIDYADFHIEIFGAVRRPFLIFNVADAAITIGVVLILARALFLSEKSEEDDANESGHKDGAKNDRAKAALEN